MANRSEAKKLLDKAVAERASAFDRQQKVVGCNGKRELRIRLLGIRMSNLRDESEEGKEKAKPGFEGVSRHRAFSPLVLI